MAIKRNGKLCKIGDSFAVFVPVGWVRYYNLKAGSLVEVVADEQVIIKPFLSGGMEND